MQETLDQLLIHLRQAWRWRWLGMLVCWLVAVSGTAYVIMLPDVYESEARIQIQADTALRPLMQGLAVNNNTRDQVRLMQQTLLSRPNLQQVARSVDLDVTVSTAAQEQAMLVALKNRIKVRAAGGQLFSVSYQDTDPGRAREVVQTLLTIFIESNLGKNREDIEKAEIFLTSQIRSYESKLKASEERSARFRAENMNVISTTGSYVEKIEKARDAVALAEQSRQEAVVMVEQLANRLASTQQYLSPGDTISEFNSEGQITATYARLRSLQQQLDDLLVRYTESHPDVIAMRKRIDALVAQYNRERSGEEIPINGGPRIFNPVYEQISLRLVDMRSEVLRLESRKENTQGQLDALAEKMSFAPAVEAEMAALNRDYGTIKTQYEALLGRREAARLSRAMESSTDSLQFKTIDPPQIPAKPSGPPRVLYLFMVLGLSFGAGGGVAFVRSQLSDTFSIPSSLSAAFEYPVIGTVSLVTDITEKARGFWRHAVFYVAASIPFAIVSVAMIMLPYAARFREMIEMSPLGSVL
jgi:polysaccharide chain length determinant protein (PEP-CTERM system associated)